MFQSIGQKLETALRDFCQTRGLPQPDSFTWTPIPFSGEWGISTSLFQLAALEARQSGQRLNVQQRAQELADAAAETLRQLPGFAHIEATRGYLNCYFSTPDYSQQVIDAALDLGARYGHGEPKHKRVMVEFSQPNTHKAFHVGHLRSAILGDCLCRLLEGAGYEVVRANYFGDIGLHVIKWLWNYMKHHAGEEPTADVTRWMGDLYAEASRRLDEDPALETEVRQVYARWDQQEPELVALWRKTRQWSLDGFDQMYQVLGIRFDKLYANSQAEMPGKQVVKELLEKGIAIDERPEGPVIVKLDQLLGLQKEKYRVLVVLRSDNTALYSTEDLALAKIKFSDYPDLYQSLYVVDVRQSLHFQQVFKTLEIAGYEWAPRCEHLPYELVNLPGNVVMASREGTVVLLEDLIREAHARALAVVEEKNPDLSSAEKNSVALAVGLGAIKYPMLARENNRIVTFDWQTALDFNGQAAPYIQYAQVRANSILRRMEAPLPGTLRPEHDLHPSEVQLIDWISRLPDEVQRAAAEYKPLAIATIGYETARAFTEFYAACPVLKAETPVREFRLRLVAAARQAMANALALLGISAPEMM